MLIAQPDPSLAEPRIFIAQPPASQGEQRQLLADEASLLAEERTPQCQPLSLLADDPAPHVQPAMVPGRRSHAGPPAGSTVGRQSRCYGDRAGFRTPAREVMRPIDPG